MSFRSLLCSLISFAFTMVPDALLPPREARYEYVLYLDQENQITTVYNQQFYTPYPNYRTTCIFESAPTDLNLPKVTTVKQLRMLNRLVSLHSRIVPIWASLMRPSVDQLHENAKIINLDENASILRS